MELRDIQSFINVADYKSFTKAAEHSYLSQPSLSKAVKKLESELHVELFDRSTRYLRLTDAGQIVYTQGKKALAALTELSNLLDELTDAEIGEIKMGVPPLIGTLFFPKIARLFHEQYPNVTLELIEMGAKVIKQLVKEDQIDIGLIVLPVDESAFNIHPFIIDDFMLYIHKDHPIARKRTVSLSELKEEKFIVFSEHFSLHDLIINACQEAGFTPSISYESSQWDLILELVASNLGIALLPHSLFIKVNNPAIKTIPLQASSLQWKLGVITKKEAYHSFALRKLLDIIKKDLK